MSEKFSEPQDDLVESFLPAEDEPLDPEEEAAELEREFEEFIEDDDLVLTGDEPTPVGRSWAFDFQRQRFMRSPRSHGPLETQGIITLRFWIEKCLRTARGAHPIHDEDYGMEHPNRIYGRPLRETQGMDLEQRIRDAVTFHPRITDITDFTTAFNPDEEYLACSFTVLLDDETTLEVTDLALVG